MPYRFKATESVAGNVRRIAREEIDSAVDLLANSPPAKRDEAIHEARKSIKKVRGLLRLVEPALGKTFRRENARLRNAGRRLSPLRDAAALLETLSHLEQLPGHAVAPSIRQGLERGKAAAGSAAVPATLSSLQSAHKRIEDWSMHHHALHALLQGLQETYRAGRRALQAARRHPTPARRHELRKRVKDLWYQLRLLNPLESEKMRTRERALKEVESRLGDDHNVNVLRTQLQRRPAAYGGKQSVKPFLQLAASYQRNLQAEAVARAEAFYRLKPKAFLESLFARRAPDTFFRHP